MLHVYLLGAPRLKLEGSHLRLDRRKALALLAYLAVTRQSQPRESLAALLWPDYETSSALAYLRREVWTLHTALGHLITSDRDSVALDHDPSLLWLDVEQFGRCLAETATHGHSAEDVCAHCISPLTEAVHLYRDRFLAGFSLKDSAPFDEWQMFQAEALHRQASESLDRLARWYAAAEPQRAIDLSQRRLKLDPLYEPAQRQLMQLYAQTNQRPAALRQYQDYARLLKAELGVEPETETARLYHSTRASNPHPNPSPSGRGALHPFHLRGKGPGDEGIQARGNLPTAATPFIGREAELEEIGHLLADPACALLGLSGLGGIGKTRLAIEAAARQHFPDGVYFVPVVGVSSPEFLVPTIADTIGFAFHKEHDLKAQLLGYLTGKQMLLVVDNFEHLLDGAGLLAEISRRVKVLVTSRERLNLQQEWTFEVSGMEVPEVDAERGDYDAAQLFVQSARRVGYVAADDDWLPIAGICRLADGMPLAIELAAAWVKTLSCEDIQREIERNLDFLTTTLRDVPARHRSLRAIFEHSWARLSADEQRLFARLAVFRGGLRRQAAESVVGATPAALATLIDQSLLRRAVSGRYSIHEMLRQYAAEKLAEGGSLLDIEESHCAYYSDFLAAHEPGLWGGDQKKTLDDITEEIENVRAAWNHAVERLRLPEVERLMTAMSLFYQMRGWFDEGSEVYRHALERLSVHTDDSVLIARLQSHRGWFREMYAAAMEAFYRTLNERVVALRHPGGEHDLEFALMVVGSCAKNLNRLDLAVRHFEEAYAIANQSGDSPWLAHIIFGYGMLSDHIGNFAQALHLYNGGLAICQARGDRVMGATLRMALGNVHRLLGDYDEALRLFREALAIWREFGVAYRAADSLNNVGLTLVALGQCDEGQTLFEEALGIHIRENVVLFAGCTYNNMGVARRVSGSPAEALRLHRLAVEIFRRVNSDWCKGFGLNDLGTALFLIGDYGGALEAHAESIALCRANGNRYDLAVGLTRQAQTLCAMGNVEQAWENLRESVTLGQAIQALPALLTTLAAAAQMNRDSALGASLWQFVADHPAADYETRQRAVAALVGRSAPELLTLETAVEAAIHP